MLTADQLHAIYKASAERVEKWVAPINMAMDLYEINTPTRQAAFLATIGHESGRLVFTRELWGPTEAQKGYEGRADLGNTQAGDGRRYCGRGLIQITGRSNYRDCGKALGIDLEESPERLEHPRAAALSAAWFWKSHNCNELADKGDFRAITRRVNGGFNGIAERLALFATAREVLGC